MLCQRCGERQAVLHKKIKINGALIEECLCAQCAAKEEESFGSIFSGLLGCPEQRTGTVCPSCGMTSEGIIEEGRAGCADCYRVFASLLEPYMQKIHGILEHKGSVPASAGPEVRRRREAEELKAKMEEAVRAQEYESAAVYRDRLREIEGR